MDLNSLWFILVTVLFIGFFFLEGFDYGVGMLNPLVAKNDTERRIVLNTFGPFWDRPCVGWQRGLVADSRRRYFCRLPQLVCYFVQRFLSSPVFGAADLDCALCGH